ncbi:MAG: hypothetical protein ABRQ25_09730 [Clostridiaceae bacterium]
MKIIARPIEMLVWFTNEGTPNPIRFRMKNDDDSLAVIKVDRVLFKENEKLAGNPMIIFRCQSLINNREVIYELKYEIKTCKWILFKI